MKRYELNIALNGQHWCRVDFGMITLTAAKARAYMLASAIKASEAFYLGHDLSFSFTEWSPEIGTEITIPPDPQV